MFFVVVRNRVVLRRNGKVGVPYVDRTETSGRSWKRCQVALETTRLCYAHLFLSLCFYLFTNIVFGLLNFFFLFNALTVEFWLFKYISFFKKKSNYFFLDLW